MKMILRSNLNCNFVLFLCYGVYLVKMCYISLFRLFSGNIYFEGFDLNCIHLYSLISTSLHYCSSICTFCVSNYSLDTNRIEAEGGVALGEALIINQTLQTLR